MKAHNFGRTVSIDIHRTAAQPPSLAQQLVHLINPPQLAASTSLSTSRLILLPRSAKSALFASQRCHLSNCVKQIHRWKHYDYLRRAKFKSCFYIKISSQLISYSCLVFEIVNPVVKSPTEGIQANFDFFGKLGACLGVGQIQRQHVPQI